MTCSDGSTIPNSSTPSGAAIVYMDDSITRRELMRDGKGPKHTRWQEETNNNHIAELAAIMMAIRSIPITISLLHYTDSQASIDGIRNILMDPGEADLRTPSRPYLNAIKDSIRVRNKHGASTVIKHVRSHTGHRDIHTIYWERTSGRICENSHAVSDGAKTTHTSGTLRTSIHDKENHTRKRRGGQHNYRTNHMYRQRFERMSI